MLRTKYGKGKLMRARARGEEGFALASAMIIMFVIMGLGLWMLANNDAQQHAAGFEQSRDSAFSLAEAALNAQISALGTSWPTGTGNQPPSACNHSTNGTTGCPDASFDSAYTIGGGGNGCTTGSMSDSWGAPVTNGWTTYVRDDGQSTNSLFNSTTDSAQPRYDGGPNGLADARLWVRAVGVENCKTVSVIAQVAAQYVPLSMPEDAISGNSFDTSNNGNKIIIDTSGRFGNFGNGQGNPNSGAGSINMRCQNVTPCTSYRPNSQISPDTCQANAAGQCTISSGGSSQTLTSTQLQTLKAMAQAAGTYFSGGANCPTSMSQLTSVTVAGGVAPVYVDDIGGACSMFFTGNGQANSPSQPGFLVLAAGTITFNGTVNYYGMIYNANLTNLSGDVVTIHGNANVQGAINVDGSGGIGFGSSKINFVYDSRVFHELKGWGGAAATPNSFRILPIGQ